MYQEGVTVPDIFRRPGNTSEQKKLIKRMSEGKTVIFSRYNFYTLASVLKVSLPIKPRLEGNDQIASDSLQQVEKTITI